MENPSGIRPVEYNCIVRQDDVESRTKGGLLKPDELIERDKHAQTRGTLVAVSPMAFAFDDWPEGLDKPRPGQRVVFARHAGTFTEGADGKEYRIVKDRDIVAVLA